MSLILIKDILNNKEFIYNNSTTTSFESCIQYLKNTYQLENSKHSIHDTFCEIFLENENTQKGWIWNSTEITKQIIYVLSFVPILSSTQTIETQTISTQTDSTQTNSTQTQTVSPLELQYRYYSQQDRLFEHFDIPPDTYTTYITDPLQICTRTTPTKKTNSTSPILDILTKELKDKLQLPNYGLKNTNHIL